MLSDENQMTPGLSRDARLGKSPVSVTYGISRTRGSATKRGDSIRSRLFLLGPLIVPVVTVLVGKAHVSFVAAGQHLVQHLSSVGAVLVPVTT